MTVSSPYVEPNRNRVRALELALQLHTTLVAFDNPDVTTAAAVVTSAKSFLDFLEGLKN